jgi:hypothetical protein
MPLAVALIAGAVVATGLFAYGASLNDVLDVRHDSTFSPQRPIPAGRIRLGQAIVVTVASLIITVVAAAPMGRLALWIMLLVAAAILFYNAAGRFIPAVGLVTIGLIHAAHMLIPNAHLSFTLPVWLVMTHAMGVGAAVHVFEDKRPRLGPRSVAGIAAGWLFWSALVIGYGAARGGIWPPGTPVWTLIWPATAVAGFLVISVWKAGAVQGAAAAEKLKRYGAGVAGGGGDCRICRHDSDQGDHRPLRSAGRLSLTQRAVRTLTVGCHGFAGDLGCHGFGRMPSRAFGALASTARLAASFLTQTPASYGRSLTQTPASCGRMAKPWHPFLGQSRGAQRVCIRGECLLLRKAQENRLVGLASPPEPSSDKPIAETD